MITTAPDRSGGAHVAFARATTSDGVTALTIFLVLLYGIPANRSIGVLGSAGPLSVVAGTGLLLWWGWHQLHRTEVGIRGRANAVHIATFVFGVAVLLSYVSAMTRALPPEEAGPADTALIRLAAYVGILLVASDGPPDFSRLVSFVRRLTVAGSLYAALGLVQFVTKQAWVDLLLLPGLTVGDSYDSVASRAGIIRPVATATHPLEYALVLSMALPVALVLALYDTKRPFLARWSPPSIIALALALSSSRSAYVGIVVALVALLPALDRVGRWVVAVGAIGVLGAAYFAAPRVITNLAYLFLSVGDDDSAASRTSGFAFAGDFLATSPVVGRGFGTLLPMYRIFDNQYLQLVLEIGILGVAAFVGLILTAATVCLAARRRLDDPLLRGIGAALASSLLAIATLIGLFDALSFPQAAGSLFMIVGLCSAYWRLSYHNLAATRPELRM